jgi:hypothetical protein
MPTMPLNPAVKVLVEKFAVQSETYTDGAYNETARRRLNVAGFSLPLRQVPGKQTAPSPLF